MKHYQDHQGNLITAAEGSVKNTYAFYRVDSKHRSRIRTRPMVFYPSLEDAATALDDYAQKRQWEPSAAKYAIASDEKPKITGGLPPLFAWQAKQDCPAGQTKPSSQPKAISDAEYEFFKEEIVRQAVLVVQTEMKGWSNLDTIRAIQIAITYVRRSEIWSDEIFSGLNKRLLNDAGEKIGSKYQIENMLGGVYVRVEGILARD